MGKHMFRRGLKKIYQHVRLETVCQKRDGYELRLHCPEGKAASNCICIVCSDYCLAFFVREFSLAGLIRVEYIH